jgi:hypothetical protein
VETLDQVVAEDPAPPGRLNREVGRDLEAVCIKALEKSPKHRYTSGAELAADLGRSLRGEPVAARSRGLPHGVRVWLRTRLKTTFRIAAVSAVTTLLLAYLMLAVSLRSIANDLLGVYGEGFPGLRPPLAIVVLDHLVPAGVAVSFGSWALFVAAVILLVSLVRGPCLAWLARPSGRWDDLVAGLTAGSAASFLLLAFMVPIWMVLLGALRPRADFEALANYARESPTDRGPSPASDRLY